MAKALNVPETEHTHGDLMLTVKAQELELVGTAFPLLCCMDFFIICQFRKVFLLLSLCHNPCLYGYLNFWGVLIMQPSTANWMLEMGQIEQVS
jgi:hypothetical protein